LPVTVGVADVDEPALEALFTGPSDGLGEYLARHKTEAAARWLGTQPDCDGYVVLGADTTVLLDNRVLGKPADAAEATHMLRSLRGRTHVVATGIAVARPALPGYRPDIRGTHVTTQVTMRPFSDREIEAYVATGDPLDKAGAYGVQHADFDPVAQIAGCYTAVVGLPLCAVAAVIGELTGSAPAPEHPSMPCPWSTRCRTPMPRWALADRPQ